MKVKAARRGLKEQVRLIIAGEIWRTVPRWRRILATFGARGAMDAWIERQKTKGRGALRFIVKKESHRKARGTA